MLRLRRGSVGMAVAATLMALLTRISAAEDGVEARAERVCAGTGQAGLSFTGAFTVDNLTIRRDANGTVTLERGGTKLGEIGQKSYVDHTVCLVEVIALISSKT